MTTSTNSVMVSSYQRCVELVNTLSKNRHACKVTVVTTASQARASPVAAAPPAPRATTVSWPSWRPPSDCSSERPLAEISVDDLAKGAGISRPTFYFYFPSKDAVLLTLLERVIVEADAALEAPIGPGPPTGTTSGGPASTCSSRRFGAHRGVSRAGYAARSTIPRSATCGRDFMQKWIDHTAAHHRGRAGNRGDAPVTLPARGSRHRAEPDERARP